MPTIATSPATPTFTPNGGIPPATPRPGASAVPALSFQWQVVLVVALAGASLRILRKY